MTPDDLYDLIHSAKNIDDIEHAEYVFGKIRDELKITDLETYEDLINTLFVKKEEFCPACRGYGELEEYEDDLHGCAIDIPLVCLDCSGTGNIF